MRWEVKEMDDGKWGIYLCEEFWKYPDKPVCYGASSNKAVITQSVEWKNAAENENEEQPEEENENGI